MDSEITNQVKDLLDEEINIYINDDYSGRGMFGEKTSALVVNEHGFKGILMLIHFLTERVKINDLSHEEFLSIIEEVSSARLDEMGKDGIVIY
jgi:hypothetical protein